MQVSMELSMYPLADDYIPAIQAFIEDLASREGVEVHTNTMSTQVFGELEVVMAALGGGLARAWSRDGKAVFVVKLINSELRPR